MDGLVVASGFSSDVPYGVSFVVDPFVVSFVVAFSMRPVGSFRLTLVVVSFVISFGVCFVVSFGVRFSVSFVVGFGFSSVDRFVVHFVVDPFIVSFGFLSVVRFGVSFVVVTFVVDVSVVCFVVVSCVVPCC